MKAPPMDNKPYKTQQMTITSGWLSSSASVAVFSGMNFQLANLDQVSTLAALFDQYQLTEIECWIVPRNLNTGSNPNYGLLASVIDYDDSTSLSTFGQATDYQNAVISSGVEGHYRRFTPHAAVAAYSGSFTAYQNVAAPWIDAASTTVQHYGLKVAWTVTDTAYVVDLITRYHVSWRNLR